MYAKIYKELFIKKYTLKKRVNDRIWVINLDNIDYYLYVYEDVEDIEGFQQYNEAELLDFRKKNINTEKRIKGNREFLEKIKKIRTSKPYLFKNSSNQISLFTYENYTTL